MRVVITGAHFTPAQAVIQELRDFPDIEIFYIGRNRTLEGDEAKSVESQVLPKLGVKFQNLIAGRLQRTLTPYTLLSLLKIPVGFVLAFYFLLKDKPDVVLSFGGYVGLPVVVGAWLLSIPVIVHEQTLVGGLANTLSNLFATKIAVSYHSNKKDDPKIILTGNPLRKELLESSKKPSKELKEFLALQTKDKLPLFLITGGNQGSHIINQIIVEIIDDLAKIAFIVHQTGDSKYLDFESLSSLRENLKYKDRYLIKKWIDVFDLSYLLGKVDLSLARAGANTLYEFSFFGVPTIVIPLPYLYKDEQNKNALYFQKVGLVEILHQSELTSQKVLHKIKASLKNIKDLKLKAKMAKSIIINDAASRLAQEVLILGEANVKNTKAT